MVTEFCCVNLESVEQHLCLSKTCCLNVGSQLSVCVSIQGNFSVKSFEIGFGGVQTIHCG